MIVFCERVGSGKTAKDCYRPALYDDFRAITGIEVLAISERGCVCRITHEKGQEAIRSSPAYRHRIIGESNPVFLRLAMRSQKVPDAVLPSDLIAWVEEPNGREDRIRPGEKGVDGGGPKARD